MPSIAKNSDKENRIRIEKILKSIQINKENRKRDTEVARSAKKSLSLSNVTLPVASDYDFRSKNFVETSSQTESVARLFCNHSTTILRPFCCSGNKLINKRYAN